MKRVQVHGSYVNIMGGARKGIGAAALLRQEELAHGAWLACARCHFIALGKTHRWNSTVLLIYPLPLHLTPDPADLFRGGEVINLHIEVSLTIPTADV